MKHSLKAVLAWAAVAVVLAGCNSQPTAEEVLRKSYQKCQSIQGGHYEMEERMKYMSGNDTTHYRYACDFKKLPDDTVYYRAFAMFEENLNSEYSRHFLYTGNEFVNYDDSTGTIMPCDPWAADIIATRHNRTFYSVLTHLSSYPLPNEERLADSTYSYSLSETRLDGKPCYLIDILAPADKEPDSIFGMMTIRQETYFWIDKKDFLPIQFATAFDVVEQQDTLYQYKECKLLSFDPNVDESKLTLESIPENIILEDYEPYKAPEPIPEGTFAPDWSLPTLAGDTIRLADLKGKVVLLDFFYKSCAPCCAALPVLQSLHEKYKDKGFMMIGIDPIDDPEKDEMTDFLAKRGVTYTVLFSERELYQTYQVWLFPTLFFLDREGKIAKVHHGFGKNMEEELEVDLVELLKK